MVRLPEGAIINITAILKSIKNKQIPVIIEFNFFIQK
jgi:hypothetical protein